ncbi:MAG: MFS transporter [Reyranella sp.]|uniref:MFS transporter n=1 Tax=Reyranella sp. TaxID=1929291 RepID=UPI001AC8B064|nr:MFS transporter [Reyranella sp.]MBN9089152.1 MFS transporter [Reyranella sp.]
MIQHPVLVRLAERLPFFYGWVIIAVAFMTMALSVSARTAFSLMFPPIVDEFGWDRGLAASAFSFGFLVSAAISPVLGRLVDRRGPRFVIEIGTLIAAAGLAGATLIASPWQLYATLGLLVGIGANCMSYSVHSQFLPNWFVANRALAIGIAFSGVGVGAILILPWLQALILHEGWRTACWKLGLIALVVLVPINLLVAKSPESLGLLPDGERTVPGGAAKKRPSNVVDTQWAATDWTVPRAIRTGRFWWLAVSFFAGGWIWYSVQIHQTKYLVEIGFDPMLAAWSLGVVAMAGIPGQIVLGALSDRVGREIVWMMSCAGYAICYGALLLLAGTPSQPLLWTMVLSQGLLGYAIAAVMGPIVAEIFEGPRFGSIFSLLMVALIGGGAVGPFVTGLLHDWTGTYTAAFALGIAFSVVCAVTVWIAAPRKVRVVAGSLR